MNSLIFLLFAVDPLGLHFESAEKVDLSYEGFTVTLVNPDTIKKLAPLLAVKGEVTKENAVPGVSHRIDITIGKKKFWLLPGLIGSEEGHISTADEKLREALLAYFQPDVEKTIAAAMRGCDELELRWRGGLTHMPLGEPGKDFFLKLLKPVGEVTTGAKMPENPHEIVFVNKETRMSLFLVGDTAYWGNRSVKLTKDTMWKMVVKSVKPAPAPKDSAGLQAAIESADSIEATRVGGESSSFKGVITLKKEDFQDWGKLGLVLGEGESSYGKDNPDAVDIVVKKGKESRKYRLVADALIFKDKSYKMEHERLWMAICGKLQKGGL